MALTSTPRVHRHRQRRRTGRLLLQIEADPQWADYLVDQKFLGEWDTENPDKVKEATQAFMKYLYGYDDVIG
jgi:hypothetical protein